MQYPDYDATADIEVINNNIKKLVQNAEEQDTQIKSKEPTIGEKNSGFNKVKTDLVENDTNKIFSAKGAFDLKSWLVTNYTTLMNNIRESLTNMINTKTPHGGYNKSSQDLKNDIDERVPYYSSTKITGIHYNPNAGLHWYINPTTAYKFWDSNNFNPESKLDKGEYEGTSKDLKNDIDGKVSKTGDRLTGGLSILATEALELIDSKENNPTIVFHNSNYRQKLSLGAGKALDFYVSNADGTNQRRLYHEGYKPTKVDVGLDLVKNWDVSSSVIDPSNTLYATAGAVKKAHDKGVEALNKANTMLPNGGYSETAQDLKIGIDNRVPYYASATIAGIHYNANIKQLHWYPTADEGRKFWDSGNFNPDDKFNITGGRITGDVSISGGIQSREFTTNYTSEGGVAVGSFNGIYTGNADNATFDNVNFLISSWNGVGFGRKGGAIPAYINCRTGEFGTRGNITCSDIWFSSSPKTYIESATQIDLRHYSGNRFIVSGTLHVSDSNYGTRSVPFSFYWSAGLYQTLTFEGSNWLHAAYLYVSSDGVITMSASRGTCSIGAVNIAKIG